MSDLKVDGIISSTGTNTNLELSGKGTGGVKITDYLIQTKGGDIASDTALTLGKDGNQFDVTGTTTITSIATQGIGSYVTLHFDGILTFTHHSTNLILPGAANITTAAGDIAVMYEYASADWRCVSYTKASGAAVVSTSPALSFVSTTVASDDATIDITFTPGDADLFIVEMQGVKPASDGVFFHARTTTDASSFDSGSANYTSQTLGVAGTTKTGSGPTSATSIAMTASPADTGSTGEEHLNGTVKIFKPSDTGLWSTIGWDLYLLGSSGTPGYPSVAKGVGYRYSAADIDGIQFYFASGNVEVGRFTLYKQVQS